MQRIQFSEPRMIIKHLHTMQRIQFSELRKIIKHLHTTQRIHEKDNKTLCSDLGKKWLT